MRQAESLHGLHALQQDFALSHACERRRERFQTSIQLVQAERETGLQHIHSECPVCSGALVMNMHGQKHTVSARDRHLENISLCGACTGHGVVEAPYVQQSTWAGDHTNMQHTSRPQILHLQHRHAHEICSPGDCKLQMAGVSNCLHMLQHAIMRG